jgi:hypothetical protein
MKTEYNWGSLARALHRLDTNAILLSSFCRCYQCISELLPVKSVPTLSYTLLWVSERRGHSYYLDRWGLKTKLLLRVPNFTIVWRLYRYNFKLFYHGLIYLLLDLLGLTLPHVGQMCNVLHPLSK